MQLSHTPSTRTPRPRATFAPRAQEPAPRRPGSSAPPAAPPAPITRAEESAAREQAIFIAYHRYRWRALRKAVRKAMRWIDAHMTCADPFNLARELYGDVRGDVSEEPEGMPAIFRTLTRAKRSVTLGEQRWVEIYFRGVPTRAEVETVERLLLWAVAAWVVDLQQPADGPYDLFPRDSVERRAVENAVVDRLIVQAAEVNARLTVAELRKLIAHYGAGQ